VAIKTLLLLLKAIAETWVDRFASTEVIIPHFCFFQLNTSVYSRHRSFIVSVALPSV
jgi:hypothetical protein